MHWELAQLNIATLLAPIDSEQLADFVAQLDEINQLADESPGFIWRLQSENGSATDLEHNFGDDVIANMSVWASVDDLHNFIYKSAHASVMSKRKQWFHRMSRVYSVLWWVPRGCKPTLTQAQDKLALLHSAGPGPEAFTFKQRFPSPDNPRGTA